ncbi:MAG TPA: PEP-CTERM sorting domain-containing protein [Chthoniobacteraceae bacterium]|nr:PEP-CTERM sorting domain-containing protein [Chthoniobacteraceae bacterium]
MVFYRIVLLGLLMGAIGFAPSAQAGPLFYAVSNDMISGNNEILIVNDDGSHAPWNITWEGDIELYNPRGIARDAAGNVYVNDSEFIYRITPSGQGGIFAVKPSESYGYGVAVDAQGYIYAVGSVNPYYGIYKFDPDGDLVDTWVSFGALSNLVVGPDGALYSGDSVGAMVYRFDPATGVRSDYASVPNAGDVAFGPDGTLYVGSFDAVYQVAEGEVSEVLNRRVYNVYGLAVDGEGKLYIGNNRSNWDNEILLHLPGTGTSSYSIFANLSDEQTITGIVMVPQAIPEPYTLSLLLAGGIFLMIYRRSKGEKRCKLLKRL